MIVISSCYCLHEILSTVPSHSFLPFVQLSTDVLFLLLEFAILIFPPQVNNTNLEI